MTTIKKIYDNGYNLEQYYKEGWYCGVDESEVPMTLVVEVTNMYDATGDDDYKDYPIVFTIGMINKNIHESIDCDSEDRTLEDIISYYGMNMYLDDVIYNMDTANKKIRDGLTINKASISSYENRFNGDQQEFLKFKNEDDAFKFAEKLVKEYGDVIMCLIGFYLDRPVNLVGNTGWEQTNLFQNGEV